MTQNRPLSAANTSPLSLNVAASVIRKSKRVHGVPVQKTFVRLEDPNQIPKLRTLQGQGRGGGGLAVKLYLSIILLATAPPYTVEDIKAEAWANLLDLNDSKTTGARRVRAALQKLENQKLISLIRFNSKPPIIKLLDPTTGGDYTPPSQKYINSGKKAKDNPENFYFQVDKNLWKYGYIQQLSSPALTFYLILVAESKNGSEKVWFNSTNFTERYKFSPNVRTKATKELQEIGLLEVKAAPIDMSGKSEGSLYKLQRRKIYSLVPPQSPGRKKK